MMLKQSGLQTMARVFALWKRFSEDSVKDKQYHEARQQIVDCPNCKLRDLDNARVRDRLEHSHKLYREKEAELLDVKESRERVGRELEQAGAIGHATQQMVAELEGVSVTMSQKLAGVDQVLWEAEIKNKALESEIERLQFELMTKDDFTSKQQSRGIAGEGGGGGGGGHGPAPENPLGLGGFFGQESSASAAKLHSRIVERTAARARHAAAAEENNASLSATQFDMPPPPRGAVQADTEAALAPAVRSFMRATPERPERADASPIRQALGGVPPPPTASPPESLLYRRPLTETDSDGSPDTDRNTTALEEDDAAAREAAAAAKKFEEENEKCERCGFRRKLTPFCPKDGTRHFFEGFGATPSIAKNYSQATVLASATTKLSKQDRETTLLPPGVPPPEFQAAPPPGTPPPVAGASPPPLAQPSPFGQNLRQSLNLDPSAYQPRHLPLMHTVAQPPIQDHADAKAVADYVRNTRMTVEVKERHRLDAGTGRQGPADAHTPVSGRNTSLRQFRQAIATPAVGGVDASASGRSSGPAWGQLFDYNDTLNGTLGITMDHVEPFGVTRQSEQAAAVPGMRYAAQQRTTPSFHMPR